MWCPSDGLRGTGTGPGTEQALGYHVGKGASARCVPWCLPNVIHGALGNSRHSEFPESQSPEVDPVRAGVGLTFSQVPQREHPVLAGQHQVGAAVAELRRSNGRGAGPHALGV